MRAWFCVLLFLLPFFGYSQIITTVAGTGVVGHVGDNGPAVAAETSNPIIGVFDSHGNYYFVHFSGSDDRVRKVDTAGIITTVAGTGSQGYNGDDIPATAAQLYSPGAVIVDTHDNLYICDHDNNRIRKVDAATGIISTIAGNGVYGFSGDNGLATNAQLRGPSDICFDKYGNLYIGDINNVRVRKVNTLGIITTYAGNGTFGFSGDGGQATLAQIAPSGLCTDNSGNLYIADAATGEQRIAKINASTGIITTIAGTDTGYIYNGDGLPATMTNINPSRIGFDNSFRNLYFTDVLNNRVRKIDAVGNIHNVAGNGVHGFGGDNGPATAAQLSYPSGVAFDVCGNIYIGDSYNNRIRKITFNPPCDTITIVRSIQDKLNVQLYPNPVSINLHIDNLLAPTTYRILNIVGITLQLGTLKEGNNIISTLALRDGMYMLELADENRKTIRKFIKQ